jgi:hypothetical protein
MINLLSQFPATLLQLSDTVCQRSLSLKHAVWILKTGSLDGQKSWTASGIFWDISAMPLPGRPKLQPTLTAQTLPAESMILVGLGS